jgi:hypothetical protein
MLRASQKTQESTLGSPASKPAVEEGIELAQFVQANNVSPQRCTRFSHKHFVSGEACQCCSVHSY